MQLKRSFCQALILLCFSHISIAQSEIIKLDKTSIPKQVKYKGKLIDAVQWKDTLGENIVVRTETGIFQTRADIENGTNSAELYAYGYLLKNDSAELAWKVVDFVKACELDITANFIDNAFFITDLNKDSVAEVWMVYETVCRGDVSPADMKIIMYEGTKKYAMRGRRRIKVSEKEVVGGEYYFDKAFFKGNIVFRDYAKKLWKKYMIPDPETL